MQPIQIKKILNISLLLKHVYVVQLISNETNYVNMGIHSVKITYSAANNQAPIQ